MQDHTKAIKVREKENGKMKKFKCEEMMCNNCVSRIEKALGEAGISHKVELNSKTVTINEDQEVKKAVELLDDLGFGAEEL